MVVIFVFLQSQILTFLPLLSITSSHLPLTQKFVGPFLEPDQGTDPTEKEPGKINQNLFLPPDQLLVGVHRLVREAGGQEELWD